MKSQKIEKLTEQEEVFADHLVDHLNDAFEKTVSDIKKKRNGETELVLFPDQAVIEKAIETAERLIELADDVEESEADFNKDEYQSAGQTILHQLEQKIVFAQLYKGQVNLLASQVVKNAGLQSLKQVSDITEISSQTLINWQTTRPALFATIIKGCLAEVGGGEPESES